MPIMASPAGEYQTMNFTADNTSDLLSFFAVGTPNGEPPFVLLDGVSLNADTPEPADARWIVVRSGCYPVEEAG
jgi:hypothetical protein